MVDNSHSVSVTDVIGIPATATIAHSPNGNICGLRLADGRLVRPWITWEIEDAGETFTIDIALHASSNPACVLGDSSATILILSLIHI